jgi:orotidine-5'-phosphate decarboxylase
MTLAPVAVALDAPDLATGIEWAKAVGPYVSTVKVGLEFFLRHGPDAVTEAAAASERPVFLDVKLHDIPNTVGAAARVLSPLSPAYLTVHASGGAAMIAAAVEALPETRVAAVTVLTSLSDADLAAVGMVGQPVDIVRRLAALAVRSGARAVVCSPAEVRAVRAEVGDDIVLITPGIRPAGAAPGDQARVATPQQALADGADLLVIGRPITAASDPGLAARRIADEIAARADS